MEPELPPLLQYIDAVTHQLNGINFQISSQGTAQRINQIVPPYDGNPKDFKAWIKAIEKCANLTETPPNRIKNIAYQSSNGPVSDFIQRFLDENDDVTWNTLKTELATRFSDVTDPQHAFSL